ncbi:STAS domain-containing protein [Streptomyces sp. NPDC004065]|uniref:STAS domain-containing protein n=1 Tax=Streptomyces sp. NPDC004065 TaxID=3364689 RepID=UPI00384F5FE8
MPVSHSRPGGDDAGRTGHEEHDAAGTVVFALYGEVDLATTLSLGTRLDALTAGPRPDVVIDLRRVTFMDCAGLGLLCRARNRAAARGGRLRLAGADASLLRLFGRTGLAGRFEWAPSAGRVAVVPSPVVPAGQG